MKTDKTQKKEDRFIDNYTGLGIVVLLIVLFLIWGIYRIFFFDNLPSTGAVNTITVNSGLLMHDVNDSNPGDGVCAVIFNEAPEVPICSLRAAIQEANANNTQDIIQFQSAVSTIELNGPLPVIVSNNSGSTSDVVLKGSGQVVKIVN